MQLTKESQNKIKKAAAALATAEAAILIKNAENVVPIFVSSTAGSMSAASEAAITTSTEKSITNSILKEYKNNIINKKGSMCVEEVIEDIGNGKIKIYSREKFVPWLEDLPESEVQKISNKIAKGSSEFKNPKIIARSISDHMNGTRHNAITSARTESLKLQYKSNTESRKALGQKYLKYVSALKETTRPWHAERHGRIFEIGKEIPLGEYNCLCTYVSADYDVEIEGAEVSNDTTVIMNKDQMKAYQSQYRSKKTATTKKATASKTPTNTKTTKTTKTTSKQTATVKKTTSKDTTTKVKTVKQNTQEFYKTYGDAKIENAYTYDKNGTLISKSVGNETGVGVSGIKDGYVVHNHPQANGLYARDLSSADISFAIENDLQSIVAVCGDNTYVALTRPASGWPKGLTRDKIIKTSDETLENLKKTGIFERYASDVKTGKMTINEASEKVDSTLAYLTGFKLGLKFTKGAVI